MTCTRRAPLLALLLVLCGCAVDRLHARRALATATAAQDHEIACTAPDACALASPYLELAQRAAVESAGGVPAHYVDLIEHGEDSLLLRVHLIRAARRSIDIQTFIFAEDDAGFLVLDELVKAARRGVRVRVIVDQLFSLADTELLAQLARAHADFELRVYNPTFHKASTPPLEFAAGVLCCFTSFNQRMHNKLLLIDGSVGIAGGRNYENRYFDWDDEFDYRDRDVLVVGAATQAMQDSFEQFWQSPHSVALSSLTDVADRILADGLQASGYAMHAYRNPERVDALLRRADDVDEISARFASQAVRVAEVEYFSDPPHRNDPPDTEHDSQLSQRILALISGAQNEIVLQTPYLVLSSTALHAFRALHKARPQLRVLASTNSLAATDAFYVYALSYKYKRRYLKAGFEIHEFKPFPAEAPELIADYSELGAPDPHDARYRKYGRAPLSRHGVRIGLHSKSIVVDGAITLIGSHNFDPRSDYYNTESGFIIHDAAFAERVRTAILHDDEPANAWTIAPRQQSHLNEEIDSVSRSLPIFDVWPFHYESSFELRPGCEPRPPTDPDFYSCYEDVGDFPEVDLPLKTIDTRIITAFGAGLHSIL
jgi:cardiolipin synthase C